MISNVKFVQVNRLNPYPDNAKKHGKKQIAKLIDSINQFGFLQPILLDKDYNIIAGHGRTQAAKQMGLQEVPCIFVEGLTDEQIRAYRIADNRLSEMGEWDMSMVEKELSALNALDFDFDVTGFNEIPKRKQDDEGYYGDAREATLNEVNLNEFDPDRAAGKWGMPILEATNHIPKDLISFNYVLNTDAFDKGVHFFIDDYQFVRLWNRPYEYIYRLSKFDCVLTPDFSMYLEMPLVMQAWNVYRSRLLGQMWQDAGMTVIPTLQWAEKDSFEFCFDGIEAGGVYAVSTIGVKRRDSQSKIWFEGMDEAMARLRPRHIIVYGGDIGYRFDCGVTYIANHNSERFKQ